MDDLEQPLMSIEIEITEGSTSHSRIDVEELEKLYVNGMGLNSSTAMCIFKVPGCLKDLKEEVYIPKVVGLGPFHHESGTLPYLKEHKTEAVLRNLIKINPDKPFGDALEKLRAEIRGMEKEIQDCYEIPFLFDPDIFILDSCFLLEFLYPYRQDCFSYPSSCKWDNIGTATSLSIMRDLIKLENQIPLILLRRLLLMQGFHNDDDVDKLIVGMIYMLYYQHRRQPKEDVILKALKKIEKKPRHLLECLQQLAGLHIGGTAALQGNNRRKEVRSQCCPSWFNTESYNDNLWSFPSAHELEKVGIELQRGSTLSFHQKWCGFKGVLTVPSIQINDSTEVIIKNIVAFEECLPSEERLLAGLMGFLACLMDKDSDVEVLKRAKIIDKNIASDKAVADFFNSSSINVSTGPDLMSLKNIMRVYYSSSWRVMIKEFMDSHIYKPWLLIGMVATILLLGLTFLQTIYAVKSYKYGN